jgi:tetratricopeptide (TPR) repeat protein
VALIGGLLALGGLWWLIHGRARPGQRLTAVVLSLTLGAVLAFGWLAVPSSARRRLATALRGSAEASGTYRLDMAAATLRLWASRPWLGSGLGAYADAVTATKRGWGGSRATHAGLAGILAAALLLIALGSRSARLLKERGDPVRRSLALGALAGVIALAVHSLLDFNLRMPANALVCAMLAALAASPAEGPARRSRRSVVVALAALLAVMALAASWRAAGAIGLAAARGEREPDARFVALSEIVRWHPYDADAWRQRARARLAAWSATNGAQARVRHERAALDLERALRLRPRWGEAWGDLAWVFWRLGDAERARDAFERATRVDPTHRWLGLAFVRFLEGHADPEAAARELARLERCNPGWRAP